ncbi:MAG: hypothetical protein JW734_09500 [Candidatus Omnitrophica bacterium]|nr:hypothetical protein [Candidatus Omnitrophota bacterium]
MRGFFIFIILVGAIFLGITEVSAQLMIETGKVQEEIIPGKMIVGSVTIYNSSNKPLDIRVYLEDFTYLPPFDGVKKFFPAGTTERSCSDWIRFSPQEFRLAPRKGKKVSYSIKVPEDVQGGYYSVLFFETSPGALQKEKIDLKLIQRIGCLFFLETSTRSKKAKIESLSSIGDTLKGNFSNQSDVILAPKGIFYVMDSSGQVVERAEITPFYLPPGEKADFTMDMPGNMSLGQYTLVLTFDLGGGDCVVKEIDFFKKGTEDLSISQVRD